MTYSEKLKIAQGKINWNRIKKIHQGNAEFINTLIYDEYISCEDAAIVETRMMDKSVYVYFDFNQEEAKIVIEGYSAHWPYQGKQEKTRTIPICNKAPRHLYKTLFTKG